MIVTPAKAGVSTLRFSYTGEIPAPSTALQALGTGFAGMTCHARVADSPPAATPAKGPA